MKDEKTLIGKSFYKFDTNSGIKEVHVLSQDKVSKMYLAALISINHGSNDIVAPKPGIVRGDIGYVTEEVMEGYAKQDQECFRKLIELDATRRSLIREVELSKRLADCAGISQFPQYEEDIAF